jgi:hypothetical protein
MRTMTNRKWVWLAGAAIVPLLALTLTAQQISSLSISGQPGQARVIQSQGRNYVEVDGLARIANGSISFNGNQIVLTLSGSGDGSGNSAPPAPAPQGFSKDFLNAGIEAMSQVREWHAALKNAIEHAYPISADWINQFKRQAQQALRLAQVAASTDSDKNLYPLLANEFGNMDQLSNKYLQMTVNMNYIDPNSLSNDPLEQKLMTCGHSLIAMASSGQFVDDGSCH